MLKKLMPIICTFLFLFTTTQILIAVEAEIDVSEYGEKPDVHETLDTLDKYKKEKEKLESEQEKLESKQTKLESKQTKLEEKIVSELKKTKSKLTKIKRNISQKDVLIKALDDVVNKQVLTLNESAQEAISTLEGFKSEEQLNFLQKLIKFIKELLNLSPKIKNREKLLNSLKDAKNKLKELSQKDLTKETETETGLSDFNKNIDAEISKISTALDAIDTYKKTTSKKNLVKNIEKIFDDVTNLANLHEIAKLIDVNKKEKMNNITDKMKDFSESSELKKKISSLTDSNIDDFREYVDKLFEEEKNNIDKLKQEDVDDFIIKSLEKSTSYDDLKKLKEKYNNDFDKNLKIPDFLNMYIDAKFKDNILYDQAKKLVDTVIEQYNIFIKGDEMNTVSIKIIKTLLDNIYNKSFDNIDSNPPLDITLYTATKLLQKLKLTNIKNIKNDLLDLCNTNNDFETMENWLLKLTKDENISVSKDNTYKAYIDTVFKKIETIKNLKKEGTLLNAIEKVKANKKALAYFTEKIDSMQFEGKTRIVNKLMKP